METEIMQNKFDEIKKHLSKIADLISEIKTEQNVAILVLTLDRLVEAKCYLHVVRKMNEAKEKTDAN